MKKPELLRVPNNIEKALRPLAERNSGSLYGKGNPKKCSECGGRGKCPQCHALSLLCPWCGGSGRCLKCS